MKIWAIFVTVKVESPEVTLDISKVEPSPVLDPSLVKVTFKSRDVLALEILLIVNIIPLPDLNEYGSVDTGTVAESLPELLEGVVISNVLVVPFHVGIIPACLSANSIEYSWM